MKLDKVIRIINCDIEQPKTTVHEQFKAYKMFFKIFDTDIQNKDGSYKHLTQIFTEASNNFHKSKSDSAQNTKSK